MIDEGNDVYRARIALLDEQTVREYLENAKIRRDSFEKETAHMREHFNKCVDSVKSCVIHGRQAKFDLFKIEQDLQLLPRMRGVVFIEETHRLFKEGARLGEVWRYNAREAKRMAKDAQRTHRYIKQLHTRGENFIKNLEDRLAEIEATKPKP